MSLHKKGQTCIMKHEIRNEITNERKNQIWCSFSLIYYNQIMGSLIILPISPES